MVHHAQLTGKLAHVTTQLDKMATLTTLRANWAWGLRKSPQYVYSTWLHSLHSPLRFFSAARGSCTSLFDLPLVHRVQDEFMAFPALP